MIKNTLYQVVDDISTLNYGIENHLRVSQKALTEDEIILIRAMALLVQVHENKKVVAANA